MEAVPCFSHRLLYLSLTHPRRFLPETIRTLQFRRNPSLHFHSFRKRTLGILLLSPNSLPRRVPFLIPINVPSSSSRNFCPRAGWLVGLGGKKPSLPDIVKAGDPVLHEPARELDPSEVRSEEIQKIIDDMIKVMRRAPGVGLAAPQIGIPFKIIVLEDTEEYISYAPKEETKAQDRRPFDLLVMVNPKLKPKSDKKAIFFEGCLSVQEYRGAVERYQDVEVTGLDRNGQPMKVDASGWQARIFQHECDHLDGVLYVDKMTKRTFRTVENLDLPLPTGCPKLGPC